jgi:predicted dithiol-disulfide oxidoreductase (DUF899 family)
MTQTTTLDQAKTVSRQEWLEARLRLLAREKELTRELDAVAAERRRLPWVRIDKEYRFESKEGAKSLADLFAGRSQLIVYHFMFAPEWSEGCPSCSFLMDHVGGALVHLAQRDVSFAAVSRAPFSKIEAFRQRMEWRFPWVSSENSDFNYDFHVSFTPEEKVAGKIEYNYTLMDFPSIEAPGFSVFYKDQDGTIFHTYSTFARGTEELLTTYKFLDLVPKGRNEDDLPFTMSWVRHHDRYETGQLADADRPYWPDSAQPSTTETQGCCHADVATSA